MVTNTARSRGLRAGVLAASATAGVLVGLSRSVGDSWFAITSGGHLWLGAGFAGTWLLLIVGVVRHVALFVALGLLWRVLAERRTFVVQALLAVALTVAFVGLSPVLPGAIRPVAIDLRMVERLALEAACVIGLLAGGRVTSS